MAHLPECAPKIEAIYRCPDDIKNLKISVTFDDETRHFRWQQKIYGKFERDFYKDEKNCVTDLERRYHEDVSQLVDGDGVLFSYTNDDRYVPPEDQFLGLNELSRRVCEYSEMEENKSGEFELQSCVVTSLGNPVVWDACEVMYIMADLGEYVDDIWIKAEHVLCTIRYDPHRKLLLLNPDFSKTKPYLLQANVDVTKNYFYFIENASEEIDLASFLKEQELCEKLFLEKAALRTQFIDSNFDRTQTNVIHLFFEIATAGIFENDAIFVRYHIDLSANLSCADVSSLTGTTQTSKNAGLHHFSHNFEVMLQYDETNECFESPYVHFEIVSKDSWSRFRTEGLAYQCLPVFTPGYSEFRLNCVRIAPEGVRGELRRFFIGDCAAYNDICWVGLPKNFEGNAVNKYGVSVVPTGELLVKLRIVHQKSSENETPKDFLRGTNKCQSSNLLKSVAEVVRAFKRARRNMIEARKNL